MDSNGAEGGYGIDKAIKMLADAHQGAHDRAETLAAQAAQARSEERRILSAIKQLEPEHPLVKSVGTPGRPKGKKNTLDVQDRFNFDPEKFQTVWDYICGLKDDARFTRNELNDQLVGKVSPHTISRAVHRLRSVEAIRLAGTVPLKEGEGGKAPEAFAVLDVEAGNRELARNAEEYAGKTKAAS